MLGTGWLSLNSPLAGPVLCQPPFIIFFASGLDRRYMGNADACSPWTWLWMLGGARAVSLGKNYILNHQHHIRGIHYSEDSVKTLAVLG